MDWVDMLGRSRLIAMGGGSCSSFCLMLVRRSILTEGSILTERPPVPACLLSPSPRPTPKTTAMTTIASKPISLAGRLLRTILIALCALRACCSHVSLMLQKRTQRHRYSAFFSSCIGSLGMRGADGQPTFCGPADASISFC
jgi:hypothetical protein